MNGWSITMLGSGGLFAFTVWFVAWWRIPLWRTMSWQEFQPDFARRLRRVDRLQPALLVVCLVSTIGFAAAAGGAARFLSVLAAAGFFLTLVGSGTMLVPLQRRLIKGPTGEVERMRRRWYRGHLVLAGIARPHRRRHRDLVLGPVTHRKVNRNRQ